MNRMNRERSPVHCEQEILEGLRRTLPNVDAVIIADQVDEDDCGVITHTLRSMLADLAEGFPEVIFWVDSRRRIGRFRSMILKPNAVEAVAAAMPDYRGPTDDDTVFKAGEILRERSGRPVFVTRSERGIAVFDQAGRTEVHGVPLEGALDPTGAGDSATAAAVLGLASGSSSSEAALLANLVGSITVQQLGTTGRAGIDQLPERLELWRGGRPQFRGEKR